MYPLQSIPIKGVAEKKRSILSRSQGAPQNRYGGSHRDRQPADPSHRPPDFHGWQTVRPPLRQYLHIEAGINLFGEQPEDPHRVLDNSSGHVFVWQDPAIDEICRLTGDVRNQDIGRLGRTLMITSGPQGSS